MATARHIMCTAYGERPAGNKIEFLNPQNGVEEAHIPYHCTGLMYHILQLGEDAIATTADDRDVTIWRFPEMTMQCRLKGHTGLTRGMAFDQSNGLLFSASNVRGHIAI